MTWYEIRQGDCLHSICSRFGLSEERVWRHPQNGQLRTSRQPALLYPGDMVFLPTIDARTESGATERRHRLLIRPPTVRFTLRVQLNGQPRAGLAFRLVVDDTVTVTGTTNQAGDIEATISAEASRGSLEIGSDRFELQFGHLDPVAALEGLQTRLAALGCFGGTLDGAWSPGLGDAIIRFQRRQNVPATGLPDRGTQGALVDAFGQ